MSVSHPGKRLLSLIDEGIFFFLMVSGTILIRLIYPFRVRRVLPFPHEEPLILVANHQSYLDPVILQAASPRRITFMMTEIFYNLPVFRWFFRYMKCIPVKEEGRHVHSLRKAKGVLDRGGIIGIFPEGRISLDGNLQAVLPGAAFLHLLTGAAILPVAISGTFKALPKGTLLLRPSRLEVKFGRPLRASQIPGEKRKDSVVRISREIMAGIACLKEQVRTSLP